MSEAAETGHSEEMSNMFASVWVKIEVASDDEPASGSEGDTLGDKDVMNTDQRETCPAAKAGPSQAKLKKQTNRLYCNHCYYSGTCKNELAKHMAIHDRTKTKSAKKPPKSQMFSCDMCEYKSQYKGNVVLHKRKHSKEKAFKCDKCDYKTSYKNNFDKHAKTHNKEKATHVCYKCGMETQFPGRLRRHLAQMHNEVIRSKHTCERCEFSHKEKYKLTEHLKKSQTTTLLSCVFCDFKTNFKCEFRKHKQIHPMKQCRHQVSVAIDKNNCEQCQVEKARKQLQKHLKQAHNVNETINMQNYVESNLEKINTVEMGDENSTDSIDKSKDVVNDQTNMSNENIDLEQTVEENHNWFNSVNEAATADIDTEITNLASNMHKPKKIKSAKAAINEFEHCQSNNYTIDTNCVTLHSIQVIKTDDSDKPFRCQSCDYNSKYKASVQRHYHRHHMEDKNRPYKCVNCDYSSKTKDKMLVHNKRSASTAELKCESCDFVTSFKCSLIYHEKSHYKYKCNMCSYSCKIKYNFTKHIATYHLKCQYCDFTVNKKDSVQCQQSTHTS